MFTKKIFFSYTFTFVALWMSCMASILYAQDTHSYPQPDTLKICGASYNILTVHGATSGQCYLWYKDSLTSTVLKKSTSEYDNYFYALTDASTTYYVSICSADGSWESKRVLVPILIKPTPVAPKVLATPTRCGAGMVRFEVEAEPSFAFLWYPCKSGCSNFINRGGGNVTFQENYFDTYLYSSGDGGIFTYTIWVEKISLDNYCPSVRIPIVATSYSVPSPIVQSQVYVCRDDIQSIKAELPMGVSNQAVVDWYADSLRRNYIKTGLEFSIPSGLTNPMNVYTTLRDPMMLNCKSDAAKGSVSIYPQSQIPSPSVEVHEECGKVTFDAYSSVANINYYWYGMDLTTPISTGSKFVNEQGSSYLTESFFVCVEDKNNCRSVRKQVQGHAKERPEPPNTDLYERCGPGALTIKLPGGSKSEVYKWYDQYGYRIYGENRAEYTTPYLEQSTKYQVSIIGLNGCESAKQELTASVKPGVVIHTSSDKICQGDVALLIASGGNYYRWIENGITISNRTTIYVNPPVSTEYTLVDPTIAGACGTAKIQIQVGKQSDCRALSLEENVENNIEQQMNVTPTEATINASPNPFSDAISIQNIPENARIVVKDMLGRAVYGENNVPSGAYLLKASWKPGQYYIEIYWSNNVKRISILKTD